MLSLVLGEKRKRCLNTTELQRRHKISLLGKLYKIIEYIKARSKRTWVLLTINGGKMVKQDNNTR